MIAPSPATEGDRPQPVPSVISLEVGVRFFLRVVWLWELWFEGVPRVHVLKTSLLMQPCWEVESNERR
jgi:hypothetical protein